MLTNCFRFAPRDSVPGLIAKICKYLKDHPGWSAEEIAEEIQKFAESAGVESFNGRTGDVVLAADDVNNLRIATAYFAEGDEVINDLDLSTLYKNGIRFVFTNFNTVTSGYDLGYALELFSDDNVVYYPLAVGGGGGSVSVLSVNGKTGTVVLSLGDILGDSGAQVKLCTATEFASSTIETWNTYYESGFRLVCVVNDEATAVDFLYVLNQDVNNHQPIMISSGSGESAVTSVNSMTGAVTIPVVDVSGGDSEDIFAKMFINENEDYPIVPAVDSYKLGGQLPSYYATSERVSQLSQQKANLAGWTPNKIVGTDDVGNLVAQDPPEGSGGDADTLGGVPAEEYAQKILISDAYDPTKETYVAGDYCVYGNKLYKRKIDASGAEPIFLPENWKEANLATELRSISTPNYSLNALVIPPGTSILQFPSFADNYSVRFAVVDQSSDIVDWDTNMPKVAYANIMINRYGSTCMSVFFGCDSTTGEPVVVMVANVANSLIKWKRII